MIVMGLDFKADNAINDLQHSSDLMDEPLCILVCAPLKVEKIISPSLSCLDTMRCSRRMSCERSLAGMIVTGLDLQADNAIRDHKQSGN